MLRGSLPLVPAFVLLTAACSGGGGAATPATATPSASPEPRASASAEASATASKLCAHARDRVATLSEYDRVAATRDAPDDQRSMAEARGLQITASIRAHFPEICEVLEGEQLECMASIDRYADAAEAAQAGAQQCAGEGNDCERWYAERRAAEDAFGDCHDVVEQVTGMAISLGRSDAQNGMPGTMVQDNNDQFLARPYAGEFARDGGGGQPPEVSQLEAEVDGALDSDLVRRIVRAHINEVRFCYNEGLQRDPSLAGTVTVEWTITAAGKVSVSTAVDAEQFPDPKVPTCVAKMVKRWMFPKPRGGGEVHVRYPFILDPG